MSSKTTHQRIDKELINKVRKDLPELSINELAKVGYSVLKGMNKTGEFIYGKNVWKNFKKK